MIVFDVTDPDSFNNLNTWLMEVEKYKILFNFLFFKLNFNFIFLEMHLRMSINY